MMEQKNKEENQIHKEVGIEKSDKKIKGNKIIKVAIIVGVAIITLSIAYYCVIFLPQKEQNKLNFEREKWQAEQDGKKKAAEDAAQNATSNRLLLNLCLTSADETYSAQWEKECESRKLGKDCSLPTQIANDVGDYRKELKDDCYKNYPQ